MQHHVKSPDFADFDAALNDQETWPHASALIEALRGCRHPRSGRLVARLRDCRNGDELVLLHGDVFHLLVLSFGIAEARRRIPPLQ